MNKQIADLWIADLRSNPPQSRKVLFDGHGYCCLGRLCVVQGLEPRVFDYNGVKRFEFDGCETLLPDTIANAADIASSEGRYADRSLVDDNDTGKSFAEIADIIEKHWEEL